MWKNFMQLSNICNYQYFIFVGLIVTDVGTSELHFCSLHWIQKYLNPKKLWPVQNPLILYYPHAYPPAILSHPMHALPLFCFTPCMPSPCSVSHMHALPLFYPTSFIPFPLFYLSPCIPCLLFYPSPCIPSPYSIPPYAYPAPHSILIPAHAYLPLFYPTPCIPFPHSIPAHAHSPLIPSQPYTPSPYSIPPHTCPPLILSHCMLPCSLLLAHICHPSIVFQLMHALLTPCHMNLEGVFLLWHLRMPTLSISSSFT